MYFKGYGVDQDYDEALKWYSKAAKQGDVSAQEELKQYVKSAEQGDAYAHFNLGEMYFQGEHVLQDYKQAHMWYNLAAANGHEQARVNREELSKKMTSDQIAEAQKMAREWMEEFEKRKEE